MQHGKIFEPEELSEKNLIKKEKENVMELIYFPERKSLSLSLIFKYEYSNILSKHKCLSDVFKPFKKGQVRF